MSEGAEGFRIASAFVQVDPDADTFEDQLEAQLGALKYVVTVPVVPDAGGLAADVDEAAAASKATITVPVLPDTEGFQLLIDDAVEQAKATVTVPVVPDVAGLPEAIDEAVAAADKPVTIPVLPDMGTFAETAETEAGEAGQASGAAFSEKLAATVASGLSTVWPDTFAGAGIAGADGGTLFGDQFAIAAEPRLSALLGAQAANIILPAGEAGGMAGAEFASRFTAAADAIPEAMVGIGAEVGAAGAEAGAAYSSRMLAVIEGTIPERIPGMIEGSIPAATAAGEEAGAGFASRFSAALAGVAARMDEMFAGAGAEGAAAGAEAGEGFSAGLRKTLTGGSLMEILIPSALVAGVAVLASKFQSAMEMIHTQAGVAQSAIAGLSGGVLTLAGKVGESPDSLASALYHVESSFQSVGITGQRALSLVQIAAEGARTGGANLVDVTNALDATIVAGVPGINSYSQAMGALNSIVGSGDMTMENLAEALGSGVMALAKSYGQNIYQVGAALATLGDNNIRGAKAATDLKMAWQALQVPLTTSKPLLESIGLTYTQLGTTMEHQGMTVAIQQFVDHLKASKVPVAEWGQYVTAIFGKRAGAGIGIFIDQLDRLKGKLPDIEKGAHTFASAWAATQATTAQKLHELEGSFEALGVKIGTKLLPYINQFMGYIVKGLPGLEHFAGSLAHIVAPVVGAFLKGLSGIVKELVGFLKDNEGKVEKFAKEMVKLNLPVVQTFFSTLLGVVKELVGDIEGWLPKFAKLAGVIDKIANPLVSAFIVGLGGIFKLLLGPLKDVTLAVGIFVGVWAALTAVMEINPFIAIATALIILVGLIIKYHKQILHFIEETWDDVFKFLKDLWNDVVDFAKSYWLEILLGPAGLIVKYHNDIFGFIERIWNDIFDFLKTIVGGAVLWLKSAWDTIWSDVKSVWGDISSWFSTWWDDEVSGWERIVTTVLGWLKSAWNTIRTDAVNGFDDLRNDVRGVWDGILHDIEAVVDKIKSLVSDITGLPGKALSDVKDALGDVGIHLAGGGVLAGYAPGHDSIPAKLSPGEAVLVPEAVRAIGAPTINAINAHYSAGRTGGKGYSTGGIAGPAPYGAPVSAMASQVAGSAIAEQGPAGSVTGITVNFYGSNLPTPEQMQAISLELTRAVAMA